MLRSYLYNHSLVALITYFHASLCMKVDYLFSCKCIVPFNQLEHSSYTLILYSVMALLISYDYIIGLRGVRKLRSSHLHYSIIFTIIITTGSLTRYYSDSSFTHLNADMKIEPNFGLGASEVASNDEASGEEDAKRNSHQQPVEVEVAEPFPITA